MEKIMIDRTGFIKKAKQHTGWYITIVPEGRGYLILYTNGADRDSTTEGYDHWVLKDDLGKYFEEAQLDVEWLKSDRPV